MARQVSMDSCRQRRQRRQQGVGVVVVVVAWLELCWQLDVGWTRGVLIGMLCVQSVQGPGCGCVFGSAWCKWMMSEV